MTRTAEKQTGEIEFTGRHVKVTPALKTFAKEKLARIRRLMDGPLELHVILTVEKHRHVAEIVAHGRNLSLSAKEETQDMYSSIGECIDKLETQARKHKEKLATRRRKSAPAREPEAPDPAGRTGRATTARRAGTRRRKKPAESDDNDAAPRIVRTAMARRKPMSVEEAALHVMDTDLGFIVFRNDESQAINVLFRRDDGSFGLIEPEG